MFQGKASSPSDVSRKPMVSFRRANGFFREEALNFLTKHRECTPRPAQCCVMSLVRYYAFLLRYVLVLLQEMLNHVVDLQFFAGSPITTSNCIYGKRCCNCFTAATQLEQSGLFENKTAVDGHTMWLSAAQTTRLRSASNLNSASWHRSYILPFPSGVSIDCIW